jgi:hypothetical protein
MPASQGKSRFSLSAERSEDQNPFATKKLMGELNLTAISGFSAFKRTTVLMLATWN